MGECNGAGRFKGMSSPAAKRKPPPAARLVFLAALALAVALAVPSTFSPSGTGTGLHDLFARDSEQIAPFVPTPHEIVERMLQVAELKPGDLLYDLGSGDGRIVIAAAKNYGVKAVGFEINPVLVKEARESIRTAGLEHFAEIHQEDVREIDLSPASVLTLYLYPGANLRLRSAIRREMKPGSRVVSHNYGMGDWKPDHLERLTDSMGVVRTIYLWRIREKS
jgi:SAM-dependent methyltransferase